MTESGLDVSAVELLPACEDPTSPFRSANLRVFSQTTTVFVLPLNVLGIYCILFKSTAKLGAFKYHILVYQIGVTLMDVSFTLLVNPIFYCPVQGGAVAGILSTFGIPIKLQFSLGVLAPLSVIAVAITTMFVYRHQAIVPPTSRWRTSTTSVRVTYVALHYAFAFVFPCVAYFNVPPDQLGLQLQVAKKYNCSPPGLFSPNAILIEGNGRTSTLVVGFYALLLASVEVQTAVFHSFWHLTNTKTISPATRRLQIQLLRYLCLQLSIPTVMLWVPIGYFAYSVVFDYYYQELNNVVMFWATLHDVSSTVILLLANENYRKFVFCRSQIRFRSIKRTNQIIEVHFAKETARANKKDTPYSFSLNDVQARI